MSRNRAEYMRAYRARQTAPPVEPRTDTQPVSVTGHAAKRIAELEAEVAHLKRLLAQKEPLRVTPLLPTTDGFGRTLTQAERDEILRKLQTKRDRF